MTEKIVIVAGGKDCQLIMPTWENALSWSFVEPSMRNRRQGRVELGTFEVVVTLLTAHRQAFVDFCQAFSSPNCICRDGIGSSPLHSCPYFCCSTTNKHCAVSSTCDVHSFDLSNLVDLPENLSRHSKKWVTRMLH